MKKYTLTESAEADLNDILGFIADRDGVPRALYVFEMIQHAIDNLTEHPYIGVRKLNLIEDEAIRWWPVSRFLIAYDAERRPIDILRVVHAARDLPRLFAREG